MRTLRSAVDPFQSTPQPRRWGDDSHGQERPIEILRFNPLPSQEGGETQPLPSSLLQRARFNPLPSQEGGETYEFQRQRIQPLCFNPLPSQEGGETSVI